MHHAGQEVVGDRGELAGAQVEQAADVVFRDRACRLHGPVGHVDAAQLARQVGHGLRVEVAAGDVGGGNRN